MEETEQYLRARSRGVSRREAAQLLLEYGAAESYARFLEKKVTTAAVRAKAIFPELGIAVLHGFAWVLSCFPQASGKPLQQVNAYGLSRRANPVFFSRVSILLYGEGKAGSCHSHNHGSAARSAEGIEYPP